MAVVLQTPVASGVLVRAEHLFIRIPLRHGPLVRVWRRGPDGGLAGHWAAVERSAEESAGQPLPLAFAS